MDKLSKSQKGKLKELSSIISKKEKKCISILAANNWNVAQAADAFYDGGYSSSGSSSSDDRPAIDEKAVNEWFDKYKEADKPDLMAVDGMLSFCEDLGVDPEDVITLVLSYHMQAERMMEYKREEFLAGMRSIGVSSLVELKAELGRLRGELDSKSSFRKIYNFAYQFARQPGVKSVDRDLGVALWRILLDGKFSLLDTWCSFVTANHKHAITKDEWSLTFEFVHSIDGDLDKFDENGAWPLLIDDFVDHCKELAKKTEKSEKTAKPEKSENVSKSDKRSSKRLSKKVDKE